MEPLEGECISILCTAHDQVWVSRTLPTGGQLSIYDAKKNCRIGKWESKDCVQKLLYSSSEDVVVAITVSDVHVFGSCQSFDDFKPILSQPYAESFTEAVQLVRVAEKGREVHLWYSVESKLKSLRISTCGITSETFRMYTNSTVEHMEPLGEASDRSLKHLVLSHRAYIEKWDVDQMERSAICDCYDLCSNLCDKDCKYMVDFFGSHGTYTMHVPVLFYMLHVHNNIKHPHAKYWWSHLFYRFYVSV